MDGLEARKLLRLRKEYTEEELVESYRREYERMQRLLRDADDEDVLQWNEELERLRVAREVLWAGLRESIVLETPQEAEARKLLRLRKGYTREDVEGAYVRESEQMQPLLEGADEEEARHWKRELERLRAAREVLRATQRGAFGRNEATVVDRVAELYVSAEEAMRAKEYRRADGEQQRRESPPSNASEQAQKAYSFGSKGGDPVEGERGGEEAQAKQQDVWRGYWEAAKSLWTFFAGFSRLRLVAALLGVFFVAGLLVCVVGSVGVAGELALLSHFWRGWLGGYLFFGAYFSIQAVVDEKWASRQRLEDVDSLGFCLRIFVGPFWACLCFFWLYAVLVQATGEWSGFLLSFVFWFGSCVGVYMALFQRKLFVEIFGKSVLGLFVAAFCEGVGMSVFRLLGVQVADLNVTFLVVCSYGGALGGGSQFVLGERYKTIHYALSAMVSGVLFALVLMSVGVTGWSLLSLLVVALCSGAGGWGFGWIVLWWKKEIVAKSL